MSDHAGKPGVRAGSSLELAETATAVTVNGKGAHADPAAHANTMEQGPGDPGQTTPLTQTDATAGARPRERPAGSELSHGRSLAHYRIDRLLGKGGMGQVYLATDTALDRQVAIKILPSEVAGNPRLRERFYREARSQARLGHPNICHIYFVGEDSDHLFFAMEYIAGESVQERLDRGGPIPFEEALELCRMAALGLREAYAHGFTHRDVKPSNLMIDRNGVVKVVDFGLVKQGSELAAGQTAGSEDASKTAAVGTPLYMAPEQAEGGAIDFRADIYALGATLHQLVAGKPPFAGRSVQEILSQHASAPRPRLTTGRRGRSPIDVLCDRMMAKNPADRYGSYDELIAAMDRVSPVRARPAGFWPRSFAFAIDFLFAGLATLAIAAVFEKLGLKPDSVDNLAFWLVGLSYSTVAHARWGRTLGKAMLAIEVVPALATGRVSYPRASLRFLVQWTPILLVTLSEVTMKAMGIKGSTADRLMGIAAGIAVLIFLFESLVVSWRSPNKLTLWDRVARTQVCYAPSGGARLTN